MAIKLVSHVMQYLTLDMIEHSSCYHANSHAAFGAVIPGLQASDAGGDWLIGTAAIADSLIQPSRGIGVHSKRSHSPWKRCSSRYLRPRLR
jgi:hypothetical protein